MRALELLAAPIVHGTVEGYHAGCHGSTCPAVIRCSEVFSRVSGDYLFRARYLSGMTVEEIVAAERADLQAEAERLMAEAAAAKEARRLARLNPRPAPAVVPQAVQAAPPVVVRTGAGGRPRLDRSTILHGTRQGYRLFPCKSMAPCPGGADGVTCAQAEANYRMSLLRAVKSS